KSAKDLVAINKRLKPNEKILIRVWSQVRSVSVALKPKYEGGASLPCAPSAASADRGLPALPRRRHPTSNIQKHRRLPAAVLSFDREAVERDRLHVGSLMMPHRIQRFAGGFRCQKISLISLLNPNVADS